MADHYSGERLVQGVGILNPMRVENLERFRFFTTLVKSGRILDLGCGLGEGSAFLSRQAGMGVIAADRSLEALIAAHSQTSSPALCWAALDGQVLSFAAAAFDGIISVEVIEHIPDPALYLSEIRRVLKPGGTVLLTTPNRLRSSPTPGSLWPEHLREYSPDELANLLRTVFTQVELLGEMIPVYEQHPLRRLVRRVAPWVKPLLPHWLRVRALPALQSMIKPDLQPGDVVFSPENLADQPTLVAICRP